jgi:hypothetical protein
MLRLVHAHFIAGMCLEERRSVCRFLYDGMANVHAHVRKYGSEIRFRLPACVRRASARELRRSRSLYAVARSPLRWAGRIIFGTM